MGDTDALRDKLRDALQEFECGTCGWHLLHDHAHVIAAVLPVVTQEVEALARGSRTYYDVVRSLTDDPDVQRAVDKAENNEATEALSLLRSRVEALVDELDQRSDETAATYRASGDRAFFGDSITRREIAQRLRRSLSDNKEQQ